MESPLDLLTKATKHNWLVNHDCQDLLSLTKELLTEFESSHSLKIIIAESDPIRFLAAFLAACSYNHQVFLANQTWGEREWKQVFELVEPDLMWGDSKGLLGGCFAGFPVGNWQLGIGDELQEVPIKSSPTPIAKGGAKNPEIMIATGGTSGKIRFATHTWGTLMASVKGFCDYFQLEEVNSFCVLPLYHVSGLMQVMRCISTGGKLMIAPFWELKEGKYQDFDPKEFFISLVPTQLQGLMFNGDLKQWLASFKTVLLGGAPAWGDLLQQALEYQIKVALCYGMTETASQIATLKPEAFLQGQNHSGEVLPHAEVKIYDSETGLMCGVNEVGSVVIKSESVALGYYLSRFSPKGIFVTDDLGFLDEFGCLHLVGRHSDKIITGGENVFPFEVEQVIRSTGLVKDVQIIAVPHSYWGEMITAVYVANNESILSKDIEKAILGKLARFKQPKLWIAVEVIPRNLQGKVNRQQLTLLVKQYL